jgi:hypothetical protein
LTQDEIIEMTRQAGGFDATPKFLETFAKLVAAKEREACLKICEAQAQTNYWEGADVCAEAIRARGEA